MKARLHVQKWTGSAPTPHGHDATALAHGVLELDGHVITNGKVTIETEGSGILTLTAQLIVQSLEIVEHYSDTFKEIADREK